MREIKLLHVEMEYEAAAIVAALEEAGIPAYKKATPSDRGWLGMPGTMGLTERGLDVFAAETDAARAAEIVNGLGYETVFDSGGSENEPEKEGGEEYNEEENLPPEPASPARTETPAAGTGSTMLAVILTLLCVGLVVYIVDFLVKLIFPG